MSCGAVTSIDFKKDCAEILRERLKAAGYVVDSDVVLEQVLIKYFNVLKRRIASQPRTVITSKEFACPEEFKAGLSLIVKKAANGEDLTPHQSRLLMDSNYIDLLLNDWGIHHFHLGTAVKQSGLIGRTGLLLFARVTAAQFYLLDVLAHQNWTRLRLIEIMHTNWPDSIRVNKIPAAIGLEHRAADDDIQLLRRNGISYYLQVSDGTVYGSIGGGYVLSGIATDAVRETKSCIWFLRDCEQYVKKNIQELIQLAQSGAWKCKPHLTLDSDSRTPRCTQLKLIHNLHFFWGIRAFRC